MKRRELRILVGLALGCGAFVALPTAAVHAAPANAPGDVTVSPSTVRAGSTHDFFFTYHAPASQGVSGFVMFTVPPNWTLPQVGRSDRPGFVAVGARSCRAFATTQANPDGSSTISVTATCQATQFFTVKYLAATAPTLAQAYEFVASAKFGFPAVLQQFAPQPTVDVTPRGAAAVTFTTEPQDLATAGARLVPAPTVRIVDAYGNPTASSARVTISIGANPGGGTLTGTTTVTASAGVAEFADMSIDKAGRVYTLSANAVGLTGAMSTGFTVVPASLDHLVVSSDHVTIAAGESETFRARGVDAFGNSRGKVTDVTFTIVPDGSCSAASCTATKAGDHVVIGTSAGKTGAAGLYVRAGPPAALAFLIQPSTTAAGARIVPGPKVGVVDAFGNPTESKSLITVAIAANPGGATLSGTKTVQARAGAATFVDLSIDKAANGYSLSATSVLFTGVTSAPFAVTVGPPA